MAETERIAELERDLAEALERQSAADQVLEVLGGSTFELDPVFETVLQQAVQAYETLVASRDSMSLGAKSVTIAYALADLVVTAVIARLLLTDGRTSRSFLYLSASLFPTPRPILRAVAF